MGDVVQLFTTSLLLCHGYVLVITRGAVHRLSSRARNYVCHKKTSKLPLLLLLLYRIKRRIVCGSLRTVNNSPLGYL